jgi:four helix bundle protein
MKPQFDHEKLTVYQEAVRFVSWADGVLQGVPKSWAVRDQLDSASTSVPLNIAEGNGKFTAPDRCKFFDTARGSALECASCLDVLVAKKGLAPEAALEGKTMLSAIVSMLVGLIKSTSTDRVFEEQKEYVVEGRHRRDPEKEQD